MPKPIDAHDVIVTPWEFTKIHWKSEALANIFFGLPMALLTTLSWGFSPTVILRLFIFYLAIYFLIYFPLFYVFPIILTRKIKPLRDKANQGERLTLMEAREVIEFLINYPIKTAIKIFLIVFSAFALAGILIWLGALPDFKMILPIAITEAFVMGIIVGITEALINEIFMEAKISQCIENITKQYPDTLTIGLDIKRVDLSKKVFYAMFLTTVAGELVVLLFFISNFWLYLPQVLPSMLLYVLFLIILSSIYTIVIAPAFARNITQPLQRLVSWSRDVISGNTDSKVKIITNDEAYDVAVYSNRMIDELSIARKKLLHSLEVVNSDKAIITSQKNQLSVVMSGIIDGVIALDKDRKVVLSNRAAHHILNFSEDKILNRHIDNVVVLYDENDERITSEQFCNFTNPDNGKSTGHYEKNLLKMVTHDKKEKYINVSVAPTGTGEDGSTAEIIMTFHDITKEKEFEEMKLDFVSMAAHELRTPLTAILGYVSVYLGDYSKTLDEDQLLFMNRINISAKKLSSLVENLLNVTRIERDTLVLNQEEIDWVLTIEQTVTEIQYQADEKNISLTFEKPKQAFPPLHADKLRLAEVVSNLISNAIKYTPNNGAVTISVEKTDTSIVTHITDTGIGIPQNALPHLFTKFFRVSNKFVQGEKGTGLGLYISKAIVEMHKGKIWVESEEGKGSTFSFEIPLG